MRERDKVTLAGPIPVGQTEAARAWRNLLTSSLGAATGRPEQTAQWLNDAFRLNCSSVQLASLLNINAAFSCIEPRFLEALLVKCSACSFVAEELDTFLEQQVERREGSPARESSTLSLLQAVWRRINPPGTAEAARARAMGVIEKITLKNHGDLEGFINRLGKGRRTCQGAFDDESLTSMVDEMAHGQLKNALAANGGAIPKAAPSPTM